MCSPRFAGYHNQEHSESPPPVGKVGWPTLETHRLTRLLILASCQAQGERSRDTYVRATEVCVLARLDKSDFEQCLAAFPEHVERLRHYCQDELRQRREEGRTRHRNSEESSWKKSVVTLCRAASFSISNNLSKLTTRRSSSQRSGSKGTLFGDWSPKGKNGVVRKHDHSQVRAVANILSKT